MAKAMKLTASAMLKDDEKWRVESDMRTLMEAESIKNDPKRYAKVQAMAKQKMMEVAKIASDTDD